MHRAHPVTMYLTLMSSVCDGSRFYYPDIENKCKFWQCDRFNRIFHMPCAYGLVWNQTEKDCVWPVGEYECGGEADLLTI